MGQDSPIFSSIVGALLLLLALSRCCSSAKLPTSQIQSLLHLQKLLQYPRALAQIQPKNSSTDFCSFPSSPSFNLSCSYSNNSGAPTILEIHILGSSKHQLPRNFSIQSLGNVLSSFPDLRNLSLVQLGLWGSVPPKLDHLRNLQLLNLSRNFISGAIPDRLQALQSLGFLKLDNNNLSGSIPPWLSKLSNLRSLELSHNNFSGDLPVLQNPKLEYLNAGANHLGPSFPPLASAPSLRYILLGQNDITGNIPSGMLPVKVMVLDLSYNLLQGALPSGIFELQEIQVLSLNENQLRGGFSRDLKLPSSLQLLDLSSNFFTGAVPGVFLNGSARVRFGKNCLVSRVQQQYTATHCRIDVQKTKSSGRSSAGDVGIIVGIIGGGVAMLGAVGVFAWAVWRCLRSEKSGKGNDEKGEKGCGASSCADTNSVGVPSELLSNARYLSQSIRLGVHSTSHNRVFSIPELEEATANFSPSNMIAEGQHGKVFRGRLQDGAIVAIKCLSLDSRQDLRQLKIHVELLVKIRHRHLVGYLGYSLDREGESGTHNRRLFLVSEFVDNGNLRSHLSKGEGKEQLTWPQRLAAVIGAGRGIQYLHTGVVPGIFNNDVSIINVLMDQNCVAKFSDFGLGRHARTSCDFDNKVFVQKSAAHIDLDHHRRKLASDKTDVYNFGFILLEVILGRPPTFDESKSVHPKVRELEMLQTEHVPRYEVVDTSIVGTCVAESLTTVLEIASKCLAEDLSARPSMEDVLWNLQYAAQVQDRVSGEYSEELPYVSPPRSRFNRQAIRTSGPTQR